MKDIKIRLVKNKKELKQVFRIRKIVLKSSADELNQKAEIERMFILKDIGEKGSEKPCLII